MKVKSFHPTGSYLTSDLYPTQYGTHRVDKGYSFGPAIRNFHLIHYVHSGCGELHTEGKHYKIHSGQYFIIYAHQNSFYKGDDNDPWCYSWLEYDGTLAEKLTEAAGFTHSNHVLDDEDRTVEKAINTIVNDGWCSYPKLMGNVWNFFDALSRGNSTAQNTIPAEQYVIEAEAIILSRVHSHVFVNEIAQQLSINRSYLTRLFKQVKGVSPKQYIIDLKMDLAAQSLKQHDVTIREAAESVGYSDQGDFAKLFKQHFMVTPTQWKERDAYKRSLTSYGEDKSGNSD